MQRSSRDASTVPDLVEGWLAGLLPEGADPVVTLHSGIDANGMSSETLVLDAAWTEDGQRRQGKYVARVAPSAADVPVFASYDLQDQYDAIRFVGEHTDVPVPAVGLHGADRRGARHAVLPHGPGRRHRPAGRHALQLRRQLAPRRDPRGPATAAGQLGRVLAELHAIPDATTTFAYLDPARHGRRRRDADRAEPGGPRTWYEFAVPDLGRSPMVEKILAWLEANQPADPDETVLSWGDARIGNMMYDDFAPVAVLDWEMATIGPRALDVSWMAFAHSVFESIATAFELPGMPHFMREEDVQATYEQRTGVRLGELTWYHVYNATSGASSSCAPARGRSASARSRSRTTSRRCSTASRWSSATWPRWASDALAHGRVPGPPAPQPMADVGSSDRNFYDRCYLNAHDRTGDIFLITGMGYYPNLGTKDAFVLIRRGDEQTAVHLSDALDHDRLEPGRRRLPGRGRQAAARSCASSSRRPKASPWTCTGEACSRRSRRRRT